MKMHVARWLAETLTCIKASFYSTWPSVFQTRSHVGGQSLSSKTHFSSSLSSFVLLTFCSHFKVLNLLRSTVHNAAGWACKHTRDWEPGWVHLTHPRSVLWASSRRSFCFLFVPVLSIKQVVWHPSVRRSHTEWQVFLPRSHLTAKSPLPCATSSFHGGGSKTSPCLRRCDSLWVSRAPCCCSGNSKDGCWGFRVPWDERRIPPRTLGQWWGAASHDNLGQFYLSKPPEEFWQ